MTPARKVAKQMRRDTTIFADAVRSQEWVPQRVRRLQAPTT